ncbi:hypothetical protein CVT24_013028 [Panaeolus cyanescens]|uniref:FAD/NAD(P)-binding domain-containing protein n=1 Tax=Panaeolus cyanescens TaxID=181874 RepID=A0A409YUJ4_9AGAR|nr:hypothetical protein CVT24_013028 [Panaeolus cyanescens]
MTLNHDIVPDIPFPTLDRLGVDHSASFISPTVLTTSVAQGIAEAWFYLFSKAAEDGNTAAMLDLFLDEGWWRDMLAFTWDFRTFYKKTKIEAFLQSRLRLTGPSSFVLTHNSVSVDRGGPDLLCISLGFTFQTAAGHASSITRLMPTPSGEWKAHTVYTNLEGLSGYPEKTGSLRSFEPSHGKWESKRRNEREFGDRSPQVLIIGGGQSGLALAARLKVLDVSALIVEKNDRIGNNWRKRYDALCLHDPVWYDHLPYLPFPSTWPVYTPAKKLAKWLEFYAEALELDFWVSSTITHVSHDPQSKKWTVVITRKRVVDGQAVEEVRQLRVNHIVFATGMGSDVPNIPSYSGMDLFKGEIIHSTQHQSASEHVGKKVVIVGACTSAHDIAVEHYEHGIDVTMIQRSSTYVISAKTGWEVLMKGVYWEGGLPTEVADRVTASFPMFQSLELSARRTKYIAHLDKEILDGLNKVGFKTNLGIRDSGFGALAVEYGGGYYIDTGASTLIAEGKIKLKSSTNIATFTDDSLVFDDGSEIKADVVIFATGQGSSRDLITRILGPELAQRVPKMWGFNEEGEINGVWRELGIPGLWSMMGNLALARFHSSHVALQIKAIEEGIFTTRY